MLLGDDESGVTPRTRFLCILNRTERESERRCLLRVHRIRPSVGVAAQSPTGRCSHQMEPERASATCAGPGASTSVAASAPPHGASMPTLSVFEAQKLLHLAAVAKQLGLLSGECSANGNAAGKTVRKGVVSPACDPQAPTFDDIPDTMAVAAEVVPARQPLNPLVPAALRWPLISRWWPCTSSAAGEC